MVVFAKDIIAWTGKGINKLKKCENYELYGKIPVCKGMEKFSSILLEQPTETGRMFDNGLFLAFVFGFFSFLAASIYTIFVEDSKSLKEISNKVRRTTDTIVTVLRTMWTLKLSKESNALLEQEYIELQKPKVPFPPSNPYVSLERMKVMDVFPTESKESEAIEFVDQIEFSLNDEWHPPKDEENEKCLVEKPANNFDQGDQAMKNANGKSPRGKSWHSTKDSNLHILYEKNAEPYSLQSRYDEASVSHVENFSDSRRSVINTNTSTNHMDRRRQSSDFQAVNRKPSRISNLSFSSKKYRRNESSSNEFSGKGIFDQRRRDRARDQRSKSKERDCTDLNWEIKSMRVDLKSHKQRNEKPIRRNRPSITEFSR